MNTGQSKRTSPAEGTALHDAFARETARADAAELALAVVRQELADAQASVSERMRFYATLAHEIRTPLHGIGSAVEMLSETQMDPVQADLVDCMLRASRSLRALVDETLNLAKATSHPVSDDESPWSVRQVVSDVVDLMSTRAGPDVELVADIPGGLPDRARGHEGRVRQILTNITANAIRFTDRGWVRLAVAPVRDGLEFVVEDSGTGIAPERLSSIFEAFEQESASTATERGGTGLGLTVVRELVVAMGGEVTVESEVSRGSVFRVYLPLAVETDEARKRPQSRLAGRVVGVCHPDRAVRRWIAEVVRAGGGVTVSSRSVRHAQLRFEAHVASSGPMDAIVVPSHWLDAAQVLSTMAERGVHVFADPRQVAGLPPETRYVPRPLSRCRLVTGLSALLHAEAPLAAHVTVTAPEPAAPSSPTVAGRLLVVDDNSINRRIASRMLIRCGFEVVSVDGGHAALSSVERQSFDAVLMDCQMPGMDGYEATRALRERGFTMPVIAFTADVVEGMEQRCRAAGMNGFMPKPIDRKRLLEVLAQHLSPEVAPMTASAVA